MMKNYLDVQLHGVGVDADDTVLLDFNGGAVALAMPSAEALRLTAALSEASQHLHDKTGWGAALQVVGVRAAALEGPEARLTIETLGGVQFAVTIPAALLLPLSVELGRLAHRAGTSSSNEVN